jgi:hypothetical protein
MTESAIASETVQHVTSGDLQAVSPRHDDRRSSRRYPLDLDIRCKVLKNGRIISGRLHDISTKSLCFVSAEIPALSIVEGQVQLALDWPVCLADKTAMLLMAWGNVIRISGREIVVSFSRHEFRRRKA